jgi:dipeptidyl aminopeptidase/acylaminoacyl peptidase
MSAQPAPYGTWSSPVSARLLVTDAVRLSTPSADGDAIYWVEGRPSEGGRYVLVRRSATGAVEDVLPEGFSVRTMAHEYGGRCMVVHDGVAYFSNFADQRLYRLVPGQPPVAITPEPPNEQAWRYADPIVTADGRHLICVSERHGAGRVVDNSLVAFPTDGSAGPRVLAQGHDFFAAPALSPDGRWLAWVAWDHPQMPWDGTELCVAGLSETLEITGVRVVAGGITESVQEPRYGTDGSLYFISDRTGWWNLYVDAADGPVPLAPRNAEFAQPAWVFGRASYAPRPDGVVAVTWTEGGRMHLGTVDAGHELMEIPLAATSFAELSIAGDRVLAIAGSPTAPPAVVSIDIGSGECTVLKESRQVKIEATYLSVPEPIEFPTEHGLTAFGLYYAPTNHDFVATAGSLPPLIVASHGGPTSNCSSVLDFEIQFWTSRGFAVVDVDYGGSTGYGRAYRERLKGKWGVVDLDDCVNAAEFCVATGRADPAGLLIHGGSAGGYTTLCALTFRDAFAAGASYYGVGDLGALARDTHKFESRYIDGMVGPWPERRDLYEERSPIFHTDLLSTPVILFQGLEDQVVPPAQAEAMAVALRDKGVAFAYIAYEGEQHGFRKAETIVDSIEAELSFYGQILGFEPAGVLMPVDIERARPD